MRLWIVALAAAVFAAEAPQTRVQPVKDKIHGVEITDPYRWLEDQKSQPTRAWIEEQNRFSRPVLDAAPGREALKKRLGELLRIDTVGMPRVQGGRYFFSKRRSDQQLDVTYVRQGLKGSDEVLIDPHPWSPDHTVSANLVEVSQDGSLATYIVRQGGEDEVEIRLMDVGTRRDLPDRLPRARYWGPSISADKKALYYTRFGKEGPRVYHHSLGADPASDREIFGKGLGPEKAAGSALSEDGRWLLIQVAHGVGGDEKTEVYIQNLAAGGPIVPVVKEIDARFSAEIGGDTLFLQTNWKAPNGRILAADLKHPERDKWREIIPEGKAVIERFSTAGGRLFVRYLENVVSRVKVFEPDGGLVREIAFPDLGSVGAAFGRWDSSEAYFAFSSFHIPPTIFRYDVKEGGREVWHRLNAPVDSSKFELKQLWYKSRDGARAPMFVLHAKGMKLDGSHPALLTGYGGFNVAETPSFRVDAVAWVEQGGVYALANLRGGSEFGEEWHKAGMLSKKQNVFADFIAAAEHLVEQGYTRPSRLGIRGTSNGGLLVGAALTQRPDLFQAVVCRYPLLDMVRYHQFSVARWWVPEYGSSENPEQFRYLHAYSPYHRVQKGARYPAVLLVTGDADTRVDPLHARKMTALLQASTASDRPILLLYDTKAGHVGGSKPVTRQVEDQADELGFLAWQLR